MLTDTRTISANEIEDSLIIEESVDQIEDEGFNRWLYGLKQEDNLAEVILSQIVRSSQINMMQSVKASQINIIQSGDSAVVKSVNI